MSKSTRIQFSLPQLVMGAMTGMLVPLMWCEIKGVAKMREHPVFHVTPGMPKVSDMWIALAMAVGLIAIRYVVSKAFYPLSRAILPPGVRGSAFRVDRLATSLFKVLFFTWIAVFGYDVIKDEEWFPVSLGGSGDIVKVFKVFDVVPSTSLKYYVLLQIAYQMHSLLYVLLMKPLDGDTMDFVVHDFTSILAMGSSYLVNYLALSATVGFLNDSCDIFQYAFFIATDSERKPVISFMYLALLVIWGYTRLYVYPVKVISNVFVELPGNNPNASHLYYWSGEAMLCAMFGLQVWWFFLFAEKGRRKLMKKSPYMKVAQSKPLEVQDEALDKPSAW